MSLESSIFDALKSLVSNRVYQDVGPLGAVRPYITYQQVGGVAVNLLEAAHPGKRNARMQINCWATTRLAASNLGRSAESALVTTAALATSVIGAAVSVFEEDTQLYGTRQDFSVWY